MSLRCGFNEVALFDRGGVRQLGVIDRTTLVRYHRQRDEMSEATVRVSIHAACVGMLAVAEPMRTEIVIYRDGDRVWEGPITRMEYGIDYIEISAKDVMLYPYRTALHAGYSSAYPNIETVTARAARILRTELARKEALDPPINVLPYLTVHETEDTAKTSRVTLPYQKMVYEEIDDMAAKAGLDYVTVGRAIHLFDTHTPIGQGCQLSQTDFLGPVVLSAYGLDLTTRAIVTDGLGHWGSVGGIDPYYGEVEVIDTVYDEAAAVAGTSIPTTAQMVSQARRNIDGRYPVPIEVRVPDNSQINPKSQVNFDQLVPGTRFPLYVQVGGRTARQAQKLDSVTVEQTGGSSETVGATFSPFPGESIFGDDGGTTSEG